MESGSAFKGLEIELHRIAGARVLRVVHPSAQLIPEHCHDRAYIGLYTAGRYRERYDGGEAEMRGPCAVFHPAGRPHMDAVEVEGLETLTVEFEHDWLSLHGFGRKLDRSMLWKGGQVGHAARRLGTVLSAANSNEVAIGQATAQFLHLATNADSFSPPAWIEDVQKRLDEPEPCTAGDLARRLDMHPAYLAHVYRAATGEGIIEVQRRRRVEAASRLLRFTAQSLADIAIATGFCDQSHMNRCFRAVLGRTPTAVRGEAAGLPCPA